MRINISVPDDLAEKVRAYDLPTSAICQQALRSAIEHEEAKARTSEDIRAAAERLRREAALEDKRIQEGRAEGSYWARWYARPTELRATFPGDPARAHRIIMSSESAHSFYGAKYNTFQPPPESDDSYWSGFAAGAAEVWQAVAPILATSEQQHS